MNNLLSMLYPDGNSKPGFLGIWYLSNKQTKWFQDTEAANKNALSKKKQDIYFTINAMSQDLGPMSHGTEADVIMMTCLWIDIDHLGTNHDKTCLPPTIEDATWLLKNTLPSNYPASAVVHTGGGLQGYWIFKEPWLLEDDKEKEQAKNLIVRFNSKFQEVARSKGWGIDVTTSLAQVYRVPGTYNHKGSQPVKAILTEETDERYNPDDFDEILPQIDMKTNLFQERELLNIILHNDANPDQDAFQVLLDMDNKFEATFNFNRTDHMKDMSLSEYDLALANIALDWGWSDQEVANLIIKFRRKHATKEKDITKSVRIKYVSDTINKAREKQQQWKVNKYLEENRSDLRTKYAPRKSIDEAKDEKERHLLMLSHSLGIDIRKINKYLGDDPTYELILIDGTKIPIGTISNIGKFQNFKDKILAHCNLVIKRPELKKNERLSDWWDMRLELMMESVIDVNSGLDSYSSSIVSNAVYQYWQEAQVDDDVDAILTNKSPFTRFGKCWICMNSLKEYLNLNSEKYTTKELALILTKLGCIRKTLAFTKENGRMTTISVYDVTAMLNSERERENNDSDGKTGEVQTGEEDQGSLQS